jgi:hypothetical protein
VSTAPSDNYTLRRTPPWSSDPQEATHDLEAAPSAMDVDAEGDRSFDSRPGGPPDSVVSHTQSTVDDDHLHVEEPLNVVTQPNGVVIIEKLDTPAIRREKNMRRKAEKQRQAARAAEESSAPVSAASSSVPIIKQSPPPPPTIPPAPSPRPPPSTQAENKDQPGDFDFNFEEESELSELSSSSFSAPSPSAIDADESHVPPPDQDIEPPVEPPVVQKEKRKVGRPRKLQKSEAFPEGTIGMVII